MKRHNLFILAILGLLAFSLLASCTESEGATRAPDFTLQTANGVSVNLIDFRGRPVMLTFWRINCPACQFQMPFTEELFNKWSSDSIAILTINVGDRAPEVQEYMAARNIHYPVLLDTDSQVTQSYGIIGVPTTFFIDGRGFIKAHQIGAFESEVAMEAAIRQTFPNVVLRARTESKTDNSGNQGLETGPEVGKIAPDFTLQTTNNQTLSLRDFQGKTVLLNFWMSTCDACLSELPYLQTVSDNLSGEQATILAVNCGESSLAVHSVVDRLKLSLPVLIDPNGTVCAAYKRGAPTAFLIDGSGIIRSIKDDAFENPDEVNNMLGSLQ
jgi:peroxiredoxin